MDQARRAQDWQTATHEEVRRQLAALAAREVPVARAGAVAWRVMLLSRDDAESLLRALVARVNLPRPGPQEEAGLAQPPIAHPPRWRRPGCFPVRWVFASRKRREQLAPHAAYLRELFAWGLRAARTGMLDRLARADRRDRRRAAVRRRPPRPAARARDVDRGRGAARSAGRHPVRRAARAMADLRAATGVEAGSRNAVVTAVAAMRAPAVRSALEAMPLETLKEATTGTLRLGRWPLRASRRSSRCWTGGASCPGSGDRQRLPRQPGRGRRDARPGDRGGAPGPARGRADSCFRCGGGGARGMGQRTSYSRRRRRPRDRRRAAAAARRRPRRPRGPAAGRPDPRGPRLGPGRRHRDRVHRADLVAATRARGPVADSWADFISRPADYYAMLGELGYLTEDEEASHGEPPRAWWSRCVSRCCGPRR